MRKHHTRKHAQWSASATSRNWLCPGNLALAQDVPLATESRAAAWGTACHEVAEKLLRKQHVDIGTEISTERHVFHVDQEMTDCAYAYVDYIRSRITEGCDLVGIEKEFSLADVGLPMEAGGTADCVLYEPRRKRLEIVDLKTGKGHAVDAAGNAQERFYALGVLLSLNLENLPVIEVVTTIVQPRLPHRDGLIRSEILHIADLVDWATDLYPHIKAAAQALETYAAARSNTVSMDDWVDAWLNPGESQCTFCPAAGACPALRRNALEIAGAYRDDAGEIRFKSNLFAENSGEAVEADLDMIEHLEGWIRERRALAHNMAQSGHQFDHWSLVEKIGHRKFNGASTSDIIAAIRERLPLSDEQLFDRKLKSPAGLEREIGKNAVELHLADLIVRPVTGTDLIRSSNTERKATPSLIDRLFEE
jgi:hypothetical protein